MVGQLLYASFADYLGFPSTLWPLQPGLQWWDSRNSSLDQCFNYSCGGAQHKASGAGQTWWGLVFQQPFPFSHLFCRSFFFPQNFQRI